MAQQYYEEPQYDPSKGNYNLFPKKKWLADPWKHTSDYGSGTPFGVGVGPGVSQGWNQGGGMGGGEQGPSFAQTKAAFDQTVGDVRGQLSGGVDLGRFGALGGGVMQGFQNPQGFGDEVKRRALTRISEREAGLREQGLRTLQNQAGAGGFARSTSYNDVGQNMRGQSAQRINEAELGLEMQDAGLKNQRYSEALRAALGLTGVEQGYRSQLADILANVQRPLGEDVGGGGLPGAAQGYKFINERGEPLPFKPDGTPLSDWERQQAMLERQRFLMEQGMSATGQWS